jgi:hypothetical protein
MHRTERRGSRFGGVPGSFDVAEVGGNEVVYSPGLCGELF